MAGLRRAKPVSPIHSRWFMLCRCPRDHTSPMLALQTKSLHVQVLFSGLASSVWVEVDERRVLHKPR